MMLQKEELTNELNPNCIEKTEAGGHFLFFGQIALTFIKCTFVALAHNDYRVGVCACHPKFQIQGTKLIAGITAYPLLALVLWRLNEIL